MVAIDGLGCISTELLGLRLFKLKVDNKELRFIIFNDEKSFAGKFNNITFFNLVD